LIIHFLIKTEKFLYFNNAIMRKYIALLRGVNVGGKNRVEMKKLTTVFENLGFTNITTYLNSGNVIFESKENQRAKLISAIESGLAKNFAFAIQVVIRDSKSIKELAAAIPATWQNDEQQKTDILFLRDEFSNKTSVKLIEQTKDIDHVIYTGGAIIWNINRPEYRKSGMNKFIGTALYKNMTARNVNTVRKLAELLG
jgi:uncharacterized protein (DUF1697 family)